MNSAQNRRFTCFVRMSSLTSITVWINVNVSFNKCTCTSISRWNVIVWTERIMLKIITLNSVVSGWNSIKSTAWNVEFVSKFLRQNVIRLFGTPEKTQNKSIVMSFLQAQFKTNTTSGESIIERTMNNNNKHAIARRIVRSFEIDECVCFGIIL